MRKLTLVLACLLFVSALSMEAKSAFSGTYSITGTNPGAGPYKGTLTITPRGEVFDVKWSIGTLQYAGIGIVSGDTLSVAYSGGDHTWMGVVAYRVRTNGLDGKWAVYGAAPTIGTETATRK